MCNVLLAQCHPCPTWSPVLLLNASFIFLIILLVFLMNLFCRDFWRSILRVRCFGLAKILPVLYFVTSTVTETVLWSFSKLSNYTLSVVSSWLLPVLVTGAFGSVRTWRHAVWLSWRRVFCDGYSDLLDTVRMCSVVTWLCLKCTQTWVW